MFRKIAQVLVVGLISGFLVALPAAAQSGKDPASGSAASTSQVEKAKAESSAEMIKDVQQALNKEGCKLKVDGRMGKHTRSALKSYQKKNGLKATGEMDEATLAKLNVK
jgi:peptidoglycan hydrolase-like protein with peptidoglycan-binding domain